MKLHESDPTEDLKRRVQAVLRNAVGAYRDDVGVYKSLRNPALLKQVWVG